MFATLIAVLGTLAGTVVAGLMQYVSTSRTARAAAAERRREALAAAVPALLAAIVRHREQQYLKIESRAEGRCDTPESRQARYAARSVVTSAMDTLHMVTADAALLTVAQDAVNTAMAIGDVPADEVAAAGRRARVAHTALRLEAARHLTV
ncbi:MULTISPECIES: hypothetical protein [Streptomyces]|uniref:Protein kilB n=1 Tax=Streptomyces doudnae TaxID=3075536 RepID=A0ABD5EHM3_9ACTN|nr:MULTISPECIES: hypothetical protein [unclassified Streptomyces]MDT0434091.1 hypothetical protein [Streptomyces sp. DSM 41981]MYQ64979.1 hypothetical protein [Streptomyces sp. SID4950]SCD90144.1 hypothetical protein GA0115242_11683 [Streptomyces sp. SolWspMP-5a-2]